MEVDIEMHVVRHSNVCTVCSGPVLTSYWFRWTGGSVALVGPLAASSRLSDSSLLSLSCTRFINSRKSLTKIHSEFVTMTVHCLTVYFYVKTELP